MGEILVRINGYNIDPYGDHWTHIYSIPESIGGYSLSFYSIALEGWRRGLTLKFINKNRSKAHTSFELSSDIKKHQFTVSRGDLVPRKAIRTCINKYQTKQHLLEAGVPTPKGKKFFAKDNDSEMITYANELG